MSEQMTDVQHIVVVNDEEQYSVLDVDRQIPAGWQTTGVQGTREECLEHIARVWTDMRPKSLRIAMGET